MRWNKGMTIAAAVVGSILILWSGKSEQPPSGWEPLQLGTEKPTIEQELLLYSRLLRFRAIQEHLWERM